MKTEIGKFLYLHHQPGKYSSSVIISSHGGFTNEEDKFHIGKELAPGTTLHFYDEHGEVLNARIFNTIPGKRGVIASHSNSAEPWVVDYELSKFQDSHDVKLGPVTLREGGLRSGTAFGESYDDIDKEIANARSFLRVKDQLHNYGYVQKYEGMKAQGQVLGKDQAMVLSNAKKGIAGNGDWEERDVVTVRHRTGRAKSIRLLEACKAIQAFNAGYKDFYCSFCRSPM